MRAQPLVPWTPARLLGAAWAWLMTETETGLEAPRETASAAEKSPTP